MTGLSLLVLVVATFNVHYVSLRDDRMDWDERRGAVAAAVEALDADILAFQEMETFAGGSFREENLQLAYLLEQFPEYRAAAVGDPREYPSTQPIFYRPDRLQLLTQGFFFYSDTPDVIYSRSWDGRYPAYTSWARFRETESGDTFVVYNSHFDAGSADNRMQAARLLAARMEARAWPEDPVIAVGDYNAPHMFPSMRVLVRAGLRRAPARGATFHFNRGLGLFPAIDHILATEPLTFGEVRVLRERYRGTYPSDHYPVRAEVRLVPSSRR